MWVQCFLQFEYMDWLAAECGAPGTEEWRKKMFSAAVNNHFANPKAFRDAWEDGDLMLEAQIGMYGRSMPMRNS